MNTPSSESLDPFARLAHRFRPDLSNFSGESLVGRVTDVLGTLYTFPMAVIGLVWLAFVSDWTQISDKKLLLLLVVVLIILLNRLTFYLVTDFETHGGGTYGNAASSLDGVIKWSAVFLFGPTVLWVDVMVFTVRFFWALRRNRTLDRLWEALRILTFGIALTSLTPLIALQGYRAWGGVYPLATLSFQGFFLGAGVIAIQFLFENFLLWTGYLAYTLWKIKSILTPSFLFSMAKLLAFGLVPPTIANLFAAPLAGMYSQYGWPIYLLFSLALVLMALLARRMSQAMEDSRAQAVQLEKLEAFGRAILAAPPDHSALPDLLVEHAASMFAHRRMAIWIADERFLLKQPLSWDARELDALYPWLDANSKARVFSTKDSLPWIDTSNREYVSERVAPIVVAPVLDVESEQLIGGIYLELESLGQTWDTRFLNLLLSTLQALAAQIASALHRAVIYERMLAHQKTQNELEFARRVQTGFLPRSLPVVSGWQLSASLEPARQVAGDFYDLISLPSGDLGILIADVADKGVGPALYMALSRTLIRTFALQYESQPEKVLQAANRRILEDAGESLFVTSFYGVLSPVSGTLTYANAGHNPPWLLQASEGNLITLNKPRLPLGIDEDMCWDASRIILSPGDMLFLYTDGAADAVNSEQEMFGMERLAQALRDCHCGTAEEARISVLTKIRDFAGDSPQFDDITLLVIKREISVIEE